jgi:hypothetical protein
MRHAAQRSGRHADSQQKARRGRPLEPPVRLIMAATILGMLVGTIIAPADADDEAAIDAWLKDLAAIQAPAADEP